MTMKHIALVLLAALTAGSAWAQADVHPFTPPAAKETAGAVQMSSSMQTAMERMMMKRLMVIAAQSFTIKACLVSKSRGIDTCHPSTDKPAKQKKRKTSKKSVRDK